jgi:hypothetical protein
MLVKVLLLRRSGQRLSAREVRAQPALAGWIRLFSEPGLGLNRASRVAVLQMPDRRSVELYDAQLTQWDGRGMILGGEERVSTAWRKFERFKQAWWCRPMDAADALTMKALPHEPSPEDAGETDWIDNL